jgi:TP901 family phage tail tape measure protein
MATTWKVSVGVDLDVSSIQKQLDQVHGHIDLSDSTSSVQGLTAAGEQMNLTYQAAYSIFSKSVCAIASMVDQVKEMDSAVTEFRKVSDLSGAALGNYISKLTDMGGQVARTGSEMVSAATQFRKSGFTDQEAAQLSLTAAMFQNVADTAVSSEEAAASIVSQIRAYGESAEFATHVIDAYNQVANNFSVGTNDISKAMEIASAGMATYGNSFEQTIGLVTAGTEIMVKFRH